MRVFFVSPTLTSLYEVTDEQRETAFEPDQHVTEDGVTIANPLWLRARKSKVCALCVCVRARFRLRRLLC